jgi:tetratricopeptide (TPR) repeat protein
MQLEEFDIEFLAMKMSENPQSMLFARLADLYLTKEQPVEAMKLLEEGIPRFPGYYAGYIVLGKAHLAFQEYSHAFNAFSKALELSPFNQTAAKLLTTVPNKPDESTRTTDANYFSTPTAAPAPAPPADPYTLQQSDPFTMAAVPEPEIVLPSYEEPEQTMPVYTAPEESLFTQNMPDVFTAAADEPFEQQTYSAPEQVYAQPASETFPTYDEYFAQNQHRVNTDTPIRLDDYLSGDAPEVTPIAPVIEESMPSHEYVNDAYVEPDPFTTPSPSFTEPELPSAAVEPEPHYDPEPVFSSPEQAQLFAEMTGMDAPTAASSYTDLDSLTEKLQSAEKIVPEANYQPKTPVPQESSDDQAYETDAVTPTLAEIYASQGEYRAAIQAYEILMFSQPAKGADYQKRVRELTQLQMEKDGLL